MKKIDYNIIINKYDTEIRQECGIYEFNLCECLKKKDKIGCNEAYIMFRRCVINFDIKFHEKYVKNKKLITIF